MNAAIAPPANSNDKNCATEPIPAHRAPRPARPPIDLSQLPLANALAGGVAQAYVQAHQPLAGADRRPPPTNPGQPLIGNVHTRLSTIAIGDQTLPMSINDDYVAGNCYVVSPRNALVDYAEFELQQLLRTRCGPATRRLLHGLPKLLLQPAAWWLDHGRADRCVWLNNWLLSTQVYPPAWDDAPPRQLLAELTARLTRDYPDHALGWRSLNPVTNAALIRCLTELGYIAVPSRQVYLYDGRQPGYLRRHNNRLDAALLRHHLARDYRVIAPDELHVSDYDRLQHLYKLLYLDKYCPLNPQFSADWLYQGVQQGWLSLLALRRNASPLHADHAERLDGVIAWFASERVITAPIVGYDTQLPAKTGLYRMLTQLCLQLAAQQGKVLNFSSGAAHFKRLRGGEPAIEVSMVYLHHLPAHRQRVWRSVQTLLTRLAVPMLQRMEL